ncbi:hypothetical protein A4S06_02380 [Erysipelotrichaceae bacterium MTC7]|nr:hypothetical protein A4S06_02380 [Erysipelotrichaceae bacterium MTC7]
MYKILVVEDEEIIRKGLISLIDFEKYECMLVGEASNGVEGIQAIQELQPDIVISDINMPRMDGLAMIEKTIDYNYTAIIISGYSNFSYAQKAVRFGVSDYVLKPVEQKELEAALQQAIEQRNMLATYEKIQQNKDALHDIELLKVVQAKDALVQDMLQFVSAHYQERITIEDLCETLNYSESLLSRRFKQAVGLTFIEYLNRFRIQKAIELLKNKTFQPNEIPEQIGISEYKYFSVVFKKYMNCSPKQFVELLEESKTSNH